MTLIQIECVYGRKHYVSAEDLADVNQYKRLVPLRCKTGLLKKHMPIKRKIDLVGGYYIHRENIKTETNEYA